MKPSYELDMGLDPNGWVEDHRVYCPVSWCSAHNLRDALCGDADGPYEGIHEGRIREVARTQRREAAALAYLTREGFDDPGLTMAFHRLVQDAVDQGTLPGKKGRRYLVPRGVF